MSKATKRQKSPKIKSNQKSKVKSHKKVKSHQMPNVTISSASAQSQKRVYSPENIEELRKTRQKQK